MEHTPRSDRHSPLPLEPLLTPHEVCNLLRIRPATLYAWVRRGKIPYRKVGSLLRFHRSDISSRLEQQRG
jgi:excisionase family DNA binding protein